MQLPFVRDHKYQMLIDIERQVDAGANFSGQVSTVQPYQGREFEKFIVDTIRPVAPSSSFVGQLVEPQQGTISYSSTLPFK